MKSAILFFGLLACAPLSLADQSKNLEHKSFTTPSQRIEIRGLSGSEIEFKTWDKNEVSVTLKVTISSSDEVYERDYIDALEIREEKSEHALVLVFKELRRDLRSGFWSLFKGGNYVRKEIRGEVIVPKANPLTTDLSYGSLTLEGMTGELNIDGKSNTLSLKKCSNVRRVRNDYGKTEIDHSEGSLDLSGTSSTVTIASFSGPVSVDANYSTIKISDVSQSATIKSQSGRLTIEKIGGNLTVQGDYSPMNISDVKGFAQISTKSGSLRIRNVGGLNIDAPYTTVEATDVAGITGKLVSITGQSGNVILENIQSSVFLDCPYSNISLRNTSGSVDLSSKSSQIRAQEIGGDWKSRTEYSTLRLRGLKSKEVSIVNKSSSIDVEMGAVPTKIDIRNEYGNVTVDLPKGFSGDVLLDAEYGNVRTDFPLQIRNRSSSSFASGRIGSGTGAITIETRSGSIDLSQK